MDTPVLQLHIGYMAWADRQILDAVSGLDPEFVARDLGSSHGGILGTLRHIYRGEVVWLERAKGNGSIQLKEVPEPGSLSDLTSAWEALHTSWQKFADDLTDPGRRVPVSSPFFGNTTLPLWQMVLHVVNHSTLHRGQVTGMIRQGGVAPPNTDLMMFYRTQAAAAA